MGPLAYAAAATVLPPVAYMRVAGMPSLYGWLNHFDDFAETHCYIVRHGNDVGFLAQADPVLFAKCRAVQRLLEEGPAAAGARGDHALADSGE
ncbi:MAG: hypothetical protein AMK73_06250 [Planctomycetes bacterium SM23_32]|nr:MAG: hypothetical protein AMK73_06250 [Planctomycetes bacterium SM23_32]